MNKTESYQIFDRIYKRYDLLNKLLSAGIDRRWRRLFIDAIPKDASEILDIATGTGDVALATKKKFPTAHVVGVDPSINMLKIAAKKSLSSGADLVFEKGNGCDLENFKADSVDAITIAFGIRNMDDPAKCLKECRRILKPGGSLLILEFGLPKNQVLKGLYLFYFRNILPFVGGLLSGDRSAYLYLNKTVEDFAYGQEFNQKMSAVNFNVRPPLPLTGGIAYMYQGVK